MRNQSCQCPKRISVVPAVVVVVVDDDVVVVPLRVFDPFHSVLPSCMYYLPVVALAVAATSPPPAAAIPVASRAKWSIVGSFPFVILLLPWHPTLPDPNGTMILLPRGGVGTGSWFDRPHCYYYRTGWGRGRGRST